MSFGRKFCDELYVFSIAGVLKCFFSGPSAVRTQLIIVIADAPNITLAAFARPVALTNDCATKRSVIGAVQRLGMALRHAVRERCQTPQPCSGGAVSASHRSQQWICALHAAQPITHVNRLANGPRHSVCRDAAQDNVLGVARHNVAPACACDMPYHLFQVIPRLCSIHAGDGVSDQQVGHSGASVPCSAIHRSGRTR